MNAFLINPISKKALTLHKNEINECISNQFLE